MHRHLLRLITTSLVLALSFSSQAAETKIVEEFEAHLAAKRWNEALRVIEEILRQAPYTTAVNWRNYGVCLDEVGQHREAARAFLMAYSLQPDDSGTQYRVFRSYALANDTQAFIAFAESESKKKPETLDVISQAKEFEAITATNDFQRLLKTRTHKKPYSADEIYRLVITTGGSMCLTSGAPSKTIYEFVAEYEQKIGKPLNRPRRVAGLEGEIDTCFPLTELDASAQAEFIREAIDLYSGSCTRISIDRRCPPSPLDNDLMQD